MITSRKGWAAIVWFKLIDWLDEKQNYSYYSLHIDWLIDRLIDWLINWLIDWVVGSLNPWLNAWPVQWLID